MTAAEPPNQPKPKRRPRARDLAPGEVFGDFTPRRNPSAVYAYRISMYGLVPIVGLILGPIAIALGLIGRRRARRTPEVRGKNFATAGIVIGSIDLLFNATGIACLGRGLGWW